MRQPKTYKPADLSALEAFSIADRTHKVHLDDLARPAEADASMADFVASLPRTPVTEGLARLASAIVEAVDADAPVVVAFGGHVVKCGLGPVLTDLMERGVVTAVATHGAGAIHDLELAFHGETSEDPARTLRDGRFGMVGGSSTHCAASTPGGGSPTPTFRRMNSSVRNTSVTLSSPRCPPLEPRRRRRSLPVAMLMSSTTTIQDASG